MLSTALSTQKVLFFALGLNTEGLTIHCDCEEKAPATPRRVSLLHLLLQRRPEDCSLCVWRHHARYGEAVTPENPPAPALHLPPCGGESAATQPPGSGLSDLGSVSRSGVYSYKYTTVLKVSFRAFLFCKLK